ncbi:uncharacterized protein LOC123360517 [Mauremys mutica]|uniref:uncharacterized protein LOC123360517 n=1 Tax=Mauremys mutica TaxID=74926 RepID=UPI001D14993F|nr:uncharacterized protein LOC123360517 [Mauremys mutica]
MGSGLGSFTTFFFVTEVFLLFPPVTPTAHAEWGPLPTDMATNTYEALKIAFAREFNLSNCWICAQIPHHSAGLPWRAIPQNWSDICQEILITSYNIRQPFMSGRVGGNLSHNCSQERFYSLTNSSWQPFGNLLQKPTPIRLRVVPQGLLCFREPSSPNALWFAGNSSCHYYLSPTTNVTIPFLNSTGQDTGEGLQYWPPHIATQHQQGINGLVANGQAFFMCGRNAYKWLPHGWHGSCYKGFLAPPLCVVAHAPSGRSSYYRSLRATLEPIGEGDRFGMIFLPSYGVGRMAQLYKRLSVFLTQFANDTLAIDKGISSELYQLRLLSLQNRQALDYILASRGGVCALIGDECCIYVPESSQDINKHILSVEWAFNLWKAQEAEPTIFDSLWGWLPDLGGLGGGIVRLLLTGIVICFVLFLLLACCKALIHKLCTPHSPDVPLCPLIDDPDCMELNHFLSSEYEKTLPKVVECSQRRNCWCHWA